MAYYHCSPCSGLTVLKPKKPMRFDKPTRVYLTTLLPMALMYAVKNYEYTYGYNKEGKYGKYSKYNHSTESGYGYNFYFDDDDDDIVN